MNPQQIRGRVREVGARVRDLAQTEGWSGVAAKSSRQVQRRLAAARVRGELSLRTGRIPGLLSIVVPTYGVEEYIDECLVSLRNQNYDHVEIIVVDDSSPDRSAQIAAEHARHDPRVRVVHRPNGGLSAARNTGVQHARGEFLAFVDSDDVVTKEYFSSAIEALTESGSDFAVNHYDRLEGGRITPAGHWIRSAHAERRLRAKLDEFPEAMVNAVAWSKTYRRSFYDAAGLSFPEGRLYEDQPVSSRAFALARGFDMLPQIGVHWRIRNDGSSISQKQYTADNLAAHNAAVADSLAELRSAGKTEAAQTRALQLLANNMKFFARQLIRTDEEFRQLLGQALRDLWQQVPLERIVAGVDAEDKVLFSLVMANRWDDALDFIDEFGVETRRFASELTEQGFRLHLPHAESLAPELSLLSEQQQEIYSRALRVVWDDGALKVSGWVYIRLIDLATHAPTVRVRLVSRADRNRVIDLDTLTHPEPRIDRLSGYWYCDYRPGGFTATLPADRLPAEPGEWEVEVEIEAGGVVRSGPFTENSMAGSSVGARCWVGETLVHKVLWRNGLILASTRPARAASGVEVDENSLRVYGAGPAPRRFAPPATITTNTSSGWMAQIPLSSLPSGPVALRCGDLRANQPLSAPPGTRSASGEYFGDPASGIREWGVDVDGGLQIRPAQPLAHDFWLGGDQYEVELSAPFAPVGVFLQDANLNRVEGELEELPGGRLLARFAMTTTRWGRSGLALAQGKYALYLQRAGGQSIGVVPSEDLLDRLPTDELLPRYRAMGEVVPRAGDRPILALTLRVPLADDEAGSRNQHRLRAEHRVEVATRDAVLFRSLYGEVTNCNGLGIHEELRRRGTTLELLWSVQDYGVPIPEGGVALIEGTKEWHDAVAQSRYRVVNLHQSEWQIKPAGQVIIETFHGYPYKVMGHQWWEKAGFPDSQVRSFDRRARDWDYFVSPASYATDYLRAAFLDPAGATAEILEVGYPRNDILMRPEGEEIRRRTRALLGIRPDQTVSLYAPTFRDYLSADDMAATRIDFFEAEKAAKRLGDKHVLLIRGHAFNARLEGRVAGGQQIIDVTDYPDVNDLILASDAAILDYSSLRFDYALTDKPIIFFVPDLERYMAARGGIMPYEPTAPGPLVRTTDQVADLLGDLDGVRTEWAQIRAGFRQRFADLDDGNAAARVVQAVFTPRGDG